MIKWELDLWHEMWDRAGSEGLDTWYELREGLGTSSCSPEAPVGGVEVAAGVARLIGSGWEGG